ncbi:DUF3135 domain-containing protein [Patescibacteria group bacterium]
MMPVFEDKLFEKDFETLLELIHKDPIAFEQKAAVCIRECIANSFDRGQQGSREIQAKIDNALWSNFDYIKRLAEIDADGVDQMRRELADRLIVSAKPAYQLKLRVLQAHADSVPSRYKHPLASAGKMFSNMSEKFFDFRDVVNEQSKELHHLHSLSQKKPDLRLVKKE